MPKLLKLCERALGPKTITEPGVYNAIDDSLDGYSAVDVQIQPSSGDSSSVSFPASALTTEQSSMDGMPMCLFFANTPVSEALPTLNDIGDVRFFIGGTPMAPSSMGSGSLDSMGGPDIPAIQITLEAMDTNPAMMVAAFVAFGVSWQVFDPFTGNIQYTEDPTVMSICGYSMAMDPNTGAFVEPAPTFDSFEVGPHTVESAKAALIKQIFQDREAPDGIDFTRPPESYAYAGLTFNYPVNYDYSSANLSCFAGAKLTQGFTASSELYLSESTFQGAALQNTPVLNVASMGKKAFYDCGAGNTRLNFSGNTLTKDCLTNARLSSVNSDEAGVYDFGKAYQSFYVGNTGFGNASRVNIRGTEVQFSESLIRVECVNGGVTELNILSGTYSYNAVFHFWFSGRTGSLEILKAPNNILKNPGVFDLPEDLIGRTPYNLRVLDVYDLILEMADYNNFSNLETLVIRNDQSKTILWAVSDIMHLTTNSPISQGSGFIYVPDSLVDTYKNALVNRDNLQAAIKPLSEYVEA